MSSILDKYKVFYNDKVIGYYYIYSNHKATYYTEWGCPWDMEDKLKELGLEKELQETNPLKVFTDLINDANRVPGRRRILYKTPEGMREWASWYAFNKMDDGTYEAELDEAWWWGGGHNDGGTIRREIPEEWFELPYEDFLEKVVTLAAASHYGFTAEILLEKKGLKEFFGFGK